MGHLQSVGYTYQTVCFLGGDVVCTLVVGYVLLIREIISALTWHLGMGPTVALGR